MRVGRDIIKCARRANLRAFLEDNYPDTVKTIGINRAQSRAHDSLIITDNFGWYRHSTEEHGNAVDYLVQYLGYDFVSAVRVLLPYAPDYEDIICDTIVAPKKHIASDKETSKKTKDFKLPEKCSGPYARVYAYLSETRKIPTYIIDDMIEDKILYQDKRGNCVFNSCVCNYAELRGTSTYGDKPFKQIAAGSESDGYWKYPTRKKRKAYICESAIDAISLRAILGESSAAYVSMGGLKASALERITDEYDTCVIAVDNDEAGNEFYSKHCAGMERIVPVNKDWNEDLIAVQSVC